MGNPCYRRRVRLPRRKNRVSGVGMLTSTAHPLYHYRGFVFYRDYDDVIYVVGSDVFGLLTHDFSIHLSTLIPESVSHAARNWWHNRVVVSSVWPPRYRHPIDGVPWEIHGIVSEDAYQAALKSYQENRLV